MKVPCFVNFLVAVTFGWLGFNFYKRTGGFLFWECCFMFLLGAI